MYAIGNNFDNQLGTGGFESNIETVQQSNISVDGVKQIIGSKGRFIILYEDGKVLISGDSISSFISYSSDVSIHSSSLGTYVQEISCDKKILQVAAGEDFILFLLENGKVVANSSQGTKKLPFQGLVSFIAASGKYGALIFVNGSICTFSLPSYSSSGFKLYPIEFSGKAVQIALSNEHLFAIDRSKSLYKSSNRLPKCEELEREYLYSSVCQVSGSESHVLALTDDGEVYSFGSFSYDKIDIKHGNIVQVAAGIDISVFLNSDGKVLYNGTLSRYGFNESDVKMVKLKKKVYMVGAGENNILMATGYVRSPYVSAQTIIEPPMRMVASIPRNIEEKTSTLIESKQIQFLKARIEKLEQENHTLHDYVGLCEGMKNTIDHLKAVGAKKDVVISQIQKEKEEIEKKHYQEMMSLMSQMEARNEENKQLKSQIAQLTKFNQSLQLRNEETKK